MSTEKSLAEKLLKDGYLVVELKNKKPVDAIRQALCQLIADHFGEKFDPDLKTLQTRKLSDEFLGIAHGLRPDRFGWLTQVNVNSSQPVAV